ncbi:MAG: hypothetical protein ACOCSM_00850 [Bacillota bacterium]
MLIVLWILAGMDDIAHLPMVMLFVSFFANDAYAFINWHRIKSGQTLLRESMYAFEDPEGEFKKRGLTDS